MYFGIDTATASRRGPHPVSGAGVVTGSSYTTDDVPPGGRLEHFDHAQTHSEHPMRVSSTSPHDFNAHARSLDLGAVNIVDLTCSPARVDRTPHLIRDHDPELVSVIAARSGHLVVRQDGREAVLQGGDLALYTSSDPFQLLLGPEGGTPRVLRAQMPRVLISKVVPELDRATATRLPGEQGVGALLTQFLTRVAVDSQQYSPTDLPRLGNLFVDLLTATLSHEPATFALGRTRVSGYLPRIKAFVRQHLDDPQLSPASIAAAHHISVSYLHRLFQSHDTTLGAWIREERLHRARRDLTDPQLLHLPIHRIASRWGYQDHATFTRAFRTAFGSPPREFRHEMLQPRCTQAGGDRRPPPRSGLPG